MTRIQKQLGVRLFILIIISIVLYFTVGKEVNIRNEFYKKCNNKELIMMIELPNNKIAYRFNDGSQYTLSYNKAITLENYDNFCKYLKYEILEWQP